jgi:parallel beta-helix repeat protein
MFLLGRHTRTRPARQLRLEVEAVESRSLLSTLVVNPKVPQDFHTIQSAVNAAKPGDTIDVAAGTYNETVLITKTLTLLGAQAGVNPITGLRSNPANESTVDGQIAVGSTANVRVDGFSLNDPGSIPLSDERTHADTIANNIILPGAFDGASLEGDSTTFIDNRIENAVFDGIQVAGSTSASLNDTIQGNEIFGSQQDGILLLKAHGAVIGGTSPGAGNSVSGSQSAGLDVEQSTNVNAANNLLVTNGIGVNFTNSSFNLLQQNTVEFNRLEGIDVTGDQGDVILKNTVLGNATSGLQASGILLFNVSGAEAVENNSVLQNHSNGIAVDSTSAAGVKVTGNTVKGNGGDGIGLNTTSNITLAANTLSGNAVGIHLVGSSSNKFIGNVAENNKGDGILVDAKSAGNIFKDNTALNNGVFDAEDDSTGTGTAGTANFWTGNVEKKDNRGGGLGH